MFKLLISYSQSRFKVFVVINRLNSCWLKFPTIWCRQKHSRSWIVWVWTLRFSLGVYDINKKKKEEEKTYYNDVMYMK